MCVHVCVLKPPPPQEYGQGADNKQKKGWGNRVMLAFNFLHGDSESLTRRILDLLQG